jgi:hypothetical protein
MLASLATGLPEVFESTDGVDDGRVARMLEPGFPPVEAAVALEATKLPWLPVPLPFEDAVE